MIAIPDHWHAIVATEAAARKKDIYGEKPLARTIAEQQAIVRAVHQNNIIWQTGSWQRSVAPFHKAAEIVRNGLIGNVTHVEVGLPGAPHDFPNTVPGFLKRLSTVSDKIKDPSQVLSGTPAWDLAVAAPPPDLDYDTWIGPSKMEPYIDARVYQNWRWNYNTGGGQLLDWIGHHGDIAHWGLGFDLSGPSEVFGHGEFPPANAVWNVALKYTVECTYRKEITGYPNDVSLTIGGGSPAISMGTKWIGTDGWVWVDRSGFEASNPDWVKMDSLPDNQRKIPLYESSEHRRNFLDSVKSRKPTITPVDVAHHSLIPGHLGLISMLVGRKLHWDVKEEKILDDPEATALMTREYRAPYKLA
jgi:predicted dehydrogenase